jgi:methylase of polypeptide subunit release factors
MPNKNIKKIEYGDFQTPIELARHICSLLSQHNIEPLNIIEPTCGKGNFIKAALEYFPNVKKITGLDISNEYTEYARSNLAELSHSNVSKTFIINDDFFRTDWENVFNSLPAPFLIIGNPPWVTNSGLGRIKGINLPEKINFQKKRGIEAITGKSNFDISEWMINKLIECMSNKQATLAMLCKTAVARKVLFSAWKRKQRLNLAEIYHIDTKKYFDANVDACLLVISTALSSENYDCRVYENLDDNVPSFTFGYRQGHLVANIKYFEKWKHLEGKSYYRWRSGIKHDCAKVMELRREASGYRNSFDELVDLEEDYLFPMLKSSDVANGCTATPSRWMLVPQHIAGENTNQIKKSAPKTWQYLKKYNDLLSKRASSVYNGHPPFSIFGIGEYSFSQWKVAISGFYKKLSFKVVGPYLDKPVVLDDTCYFIACRSKKEACFIAELLNSNIAKEFFSAFIFWDEKRPITSDKLKKIDLLKLANELGYEETLKELLEQYPERCDQPLLFSGIVSNP